jgi:class 3 adenylate cyclase
MPTEIAPYRPILEHLAKVVEGQFCEYEKTSLELGSHLPYPRLTSILILGFIIRYRAIIMKQQAQRRLAAVLAADVVGYTRLMQADEEGTINTWWSYRHDIVDPIIEQYSGRIVKLTGDGFLAEFISATNAVLAAYAIQKSIEPRVK